ncbi:MAG TPA: serine/threonine-protein kinase [Allocoleopsis sp.]
MQPLYCSQGHKNDSTNRFCIQCGQQLPLAVGQVLDKRYRIVSQLGQGGFGRTYLAEALHRFNERCVLKEFAPQVQGAAELEKAKELFEREAGTLHQLQHPQLPKFWELFQADLGGGVGCLFLVQDYVEGQSYFDIFKSGQRLSEAQAVQFMCQILPVLSYIHLKGVIHRDISPDNIILRDSDNLPVLIDFGCIKQVAVTAVSNLTRLGTLSTRIGKKGYAPQEQMQQGKVYVSSDLYSLAVTVLVLLAGKEPKDLYDSYQGSWRWGDMKLDPQLQAILYKMLAHRPGDRFAYAVDVLEALQSQTSFSLQPNPVQKSTQAVALKANPVPNSPNAQLAPTPIAANANISQMHTLVVAPKAPPKPVPVVPATPSPVTPHANPQPAIQSPPQFPQFLMRVVFLTMKLTVGAGLIVVTGFASWAVMNSVMRSVSLGPLVERLPSTAPSNSPSSSEQNRTDNLLRRRQALAIPAGFFNKLVNDSFYGSHPELQGRSLTMSSDDAALRNEWYKIAEDLLDKLEQAQLSASARRQLGSYGQRDYQIWQRQVKQRQFGSNTIDQLKQQTDENFYQLFPQQRGKKLDLQTFGQIWYALFSDRVSQLSQ